MRLSWTMLRRLYAAVAVADRLGLDRVTAVDCVALGVSISESRLRRECTERGLDYAAVAREHMPNLSPVKRGPRLRAILGVTEQPDPTPARDRPTWAGRDAGHAFAPDVDDIDGRDFDSDG